MFTGISRLLKFLKKSFQIQSSRNKTPSPSNQDEHRFQTAVIDGIGKTYRNQWKDLPNYSRRFFGKIAGFSNDGNHAIYYNIVTNTESRLWRSNKRFEVCYSKDLSSKTFVIHFLEMRV
jgi:hypothetical protein